MLASVPAPPPSAAPATPDRTLRPLRQLVWLQATMLVVYVPWFLATRGTDMPWVWANDVFYDLLLLPGIVAAALVTMAPGVDRATRRAWRPLVLAHALAAVPPIARSIVDVRVQPLPFGTDLFWLLVYPLNFAGLLLLPSLPQSRAARRSLALDALIVAVAGIAIALAVTIVPAATHIGGRRLVLPIASYAIADLLLFVTLCIIVARRGPPAGHRAVTSLAACFGLTFMGDLVWFYGRVTAQPDVGTLTDPIWIGAELAFISAALLQVRDVGRRSDDVPRPLAWLRPTFFPHLAIAILLATLAWWSMHGRPSPWLLGGLAVAVVLLQLRQLLALRENAALLDSQRAQEARFRALVQHAADLVLVVGADGVLRYVSPSAQRVLALEDGGAPTTLPALVHPEERAPLAELLAAAAARPAGEGVGATLRCLDRQGEWRRLECVLTNLLAEPAVAGIVVNGRDVSEREALERQLAHAQKTEAIGRLAGGIAHDFNNLLAVVSANAELLRDEPLEGEAREALDEVQRAARRGADLTRRLLSFSRRQQVTQAGSIALDVALREAEPMIRRLVAKDVTVEIDARAGSAGVRLEAIQLEQVLINLAVNARDAMPEGGTLQIATRTVTLDALDARRIAGAMPGEYAEVVVRDTGHGMDEATRERLFEPFFTTKPTGDGTGLGLYIVYGLVNQASGHIVVDSAPGLGTTFRILLPRHSVDERSANPLPAVAPRGSERLLVVDDEEAIRSALQRYLQRQGYAVTIAGDGEQALALLEKHGPVDLVLTDVVMPGLDGRGLVEQVRARWPHVRVMCMSGYTEDATVRELVPPELFIAKPFALDTIGHRVRSALDAARGAASVTAA